MGDSLKVLWDQFAKDVDKAPGWGYLLFIVMVWLNLSLPNEEHLPNWMRAPLSTELIALLLTALFYKFGDAFDEAYFKERINGETRTKKHFKKKYRVKSYKARKALGVNESGLYSLASNLAAAAEKDRPTTWVYWSNEFAKLMRSVFFPMSLIGLAHLIFREFLVGIIWIAAAVIAFRLYPYLKVLHIRSLYQLAAQLKDNEKCDVKVRDDANLYFWDSKFVTAFPHRWE